MRVNTEQRHKNPSVNFGEIWANTDVKNMDDNLVQLNFAHEDDPDDIVPELNNEVKIEIKAK